jgi:hypothetical protein
MRHMLRNGAHPLPRSRRFLEYSSQCQGYSRETLNNALDCRNEWLLLIRQSTLRRQMEDFLLWTRRWEG